jgi:DNA-binding NtrC family response regulator
MSRRKKILVVDDDVDITRIVTKMLSHDDHEVETAFSGAEALEKISFRKPDIILLDIMMPQMNGLEVLRKIKEIDPSIYIIMITAFGDIDSYLDAMEWGAFEYMNKPFETEELLRMINKTTLPA